MPEGKYERCVLCGKDTNVLLTQHIDMRPNYVEGIGQLCYKCWREVYGGKKLAVQKEETW